MKRGRFWGMGWCLARGRGVSWLRRPSSGREREIPKIPRAEAGMSPWELSSGRGGRGSRSTASRAHPVPSMPPERGRPRGEGQAQAIGHFTCQLPKMVAPTFLSPSCSRLSTHAPTGRGGTGPQPPAREGAGNGSQDGIRGRN